MNMINDLNNKDAKTDHKNEEPKFAPKATRSWWGMTNPMYCTVFFESMNDLLEAKDMDSTTLNIINAKSEF